MVAIPASPSRTQLRRRSTNRGTDENSEKPSIEPVNLSPNDEDIKDFWQILRGSVGRSRSLYAKKKRKTKGASPLSLEEKEGKIPFHLDGDSFHSARSELSQSVVSLSGESWARVFQPHPLSDTMRTSPKRVNHDSRYQTLWEYAGGLPLSPTEIDVITPSADSCWGDLKSMKEVKEVKIGKSFEPGGVGLSLEANAWDRTKLGDGDSSSSPPSSPSRRMIMKEGGSSPSSPLSPSNSPARRKKKKKRSLRKAESTPVSLWGDLGCIKEVQEGNLLPIANSDLKPRKLFTDSDNYIEIEGSPWKGKVQIHDDDDIWSEDDEVGNNQSTSDRCELQNKMETSEIVDTLDHYQEIKLEPLNLSWEELLNASPSKSSVEIGDDTNWLGQLVFESQTWSTIAADPAGEGDVLKKFNKVRQSYETECITSHEAADESEKKIGVEDDKDEFCEAEHANVEEAKNCTEIAENADDNDDNYVRLIRFADEQGLPLHEEHQIGGRDDPFGEGCVVVLILDPERKKFEFLHTGFLHRSNATVGDLLRQLPGFVSNEAFADKEFEDLYLTKAGPCKLDCSSLLQDCRIDKDEIAVAVTKGSSGDYLVESAAPLLTNTSMMKAVKRAKRSGRGLKYVLSSSEIEEDLKKRCSADEEASNFSSDGAATEVDISNQTVALHNDSSQHTVMDEEYHLVPNLEDEIETDVDNDRRLFDAQGEKDTNQMIRLLHVGLVATIGVFYSLSLSQ